MKQKYIRVFPKSFESLDKLINRALFDNLDYDLFQVIHFSTFPNPEIIYYVILKLKTENE